MTLPDELPQTAALLALWNDVDPVVDADYNHWHAGEHVPERLTVPGILWGHRYRAASATPGPRYLTLYGLRDTAVLESAPYQRLLRGPTPASARMRPALRNISRWICAIRQQSGSGSGSGLPLVVWTLPADASFDTARRHHDALSGMPHVGSRLLCERLHDAPSLPWLAGGQTVAVDGDWLLCTGFESPEAAQRAAGGEWLYEPLRVG